MTSLRLHRERFQARQAFRACRLGCIATSAVWMPGSLNSALKALPGGYAPVFVTKNPEVDR